MTQHETKTMGHLAKVAERARDDVGMPHELHDGPVHHNGGRWSDGQVYTLRRENHRPLEGDLLQSLSC